MTVRYSLTNSIKVHTAGLKHKNHMNYEFTTNYFHSEFGNNSEFRLLNYIELIDENTKII